MGGDLKAWVCGSATMEEHLELGSIPTVIKNKEHCLKETQFNLSVSIWTSLCRNLCMQNTVGMHTYI